MKKFLKRVITGLLALALAYTAVPIDAHAAVLDAAGEAVQSAAGNSIGGEQIAGNEKAYFEANVNPAYSGFKEFSLANYINVKITLADGSKLPEGYKTIDMLWQYQQQDASHDAFIATYINSTYLYDLDPESKYFVARANTNMTEGVRTTDAIFAFANNLGEGIDDCIYDYDTGLCYIPKKYYFDIAKNGVYTLGSVQAQLLQIQDSLDTKKEVSVTVNDDKFFSTSVNKTEIEVDSISPDTTLKVVDDKDLATTTADDITVKVNGSAGEREDVYYNEETGEITIPDGASTVNSVQVDVKNGAISRVGRALFGVNEAHALSQDQMEYLRTTDGGEFTLKVNDGKDVPKAGDKFIIRIQEVYGEDETDSLCNSNLYYSYGFNVGTQNEIAMAIRDYTVGHTAWQNVWDQNTPPGPGEPFANIAVPTGGNGSWIQWFGQMGADDNIFNLKNSILNSAVLFGFCLFSTDGGTSPAFQTIDTADGANRTYSVVENKVAWAPGICSHIDSFTEYDRTVAEDTGEHQGLNGNYGLYEGRVTAKVLRYDDHSDAGYGDVWFSVAQYDSINSQTGTAVYKAKVLLDNKKTDITFRKYGTHESEGTSKIVEDLYGVNFNIYRPDDLVRPIAGVETHMDYGTNYNESGKTGMTAPVELDPGFYYVKEVGVGHDDDGRRNADDYLNNYFGGDTNEMAKHCEFIGINSFYRGDEGQPWNASDKTGSIDKSYCYTDASTSLGQYDQEGNGGNWTTSTIYPRLYWRSRPYEDNTSVEEYALYIPGSTMLETRYKNIVGNPGVPGQLAENYGKDDIGGTRSMPYATKVGDGMFLIYVPDRNTIDNSNQARIEYIFYNGHEEVEKGSFFKINKVDADGNDLPNVSFKIKVEDLTGTKAYKIQEDPIDANIKFVDDTLAGAEGPFYTLTTDAEGMITVELRNAAEGDEYKVTVTEVATGDASVDAFRFIKNASGKAQYVNTPADTEDEFSFKVKIVKDGEDLIGELSGAGHAKYEGSTATLDSELIKSNIFTIVNRTAPTWQFRKQFQTTVTAAEMGQVKFEVSVKDKDGNDKTFTAGGTTKEYSNTTGVYNVGEDIALTDGDVITIKETAVPEGWQEAGEIEITLSYNGVNFTSTVSNEKNGSPALVTTTGTVTVMNQKLPESHPYSFRKRDIEAVTTTAMNNGEMPQGDATLQSAHFSLYVSSKNGTQDRTCCSHGFPVPVPYKMSYKLYINGTAEATASCGCGECCSGITGTYGSFKFQGCNNGSYTVAGDLVADGYTNADGVWDTPVNGTLNLPDGWYILKEDTYAIGYSNDHHTKRTNTDGEPNGYTHTGVLTREIHLEGGQITSGGVTGYDGSTIGTIDNYPIRNGFAFQKRDWETGGNDPQGDASFAYTQFLLVNESINPVRVKTLNPKYGTSIMATDEDRFYEPGQVIALCETDKNGYFETGKDALPYGTYRIYELNSSDQSGVLNSELFYSPAKNGAFTDGRGNNGTSGGDNTALYGGDSAYGATSEGYANIQYNAERLIKNAVQVREFTIRADYGRKHSGGNGGLVQIGTDNSNENNDRDTLSYKGENYDIWKENGVNRAAQNTGRVANDEYKARTNENVDSNILPVNGSYRTLYNLVKRGGFKVQKRDFETGGDDAQGDANFAYMQFEVINRSAGRVKVVADKNDDTKSDTDNANNNVVAASRAGVATTGDAAHTQESTGVTANTTADDTSVTKTTDYVLGTNAKYQDGADFNYMKGDLNVYDRDTTSADGAERPVNFASSAVSTAEKGVVRMNVAGDEIDGGPDGDGCYAPGAVICVITTDKNGAFESTGNFLPYGTYEIREVRHPEGYDKDSIGETKTAGISIGGSTQSFGDNGTGGEDAYGDVNGDEVTGKGNGLKNTDIKTDHSYYNNENHHDALTTLEDDKAASMWNGQNAFGENKEAIISRRFHIGYELNGIETPGAYTTNSTAVEVTTTGVSNALGHGSALRDEENANARRYQRYDYAIVDLTDADRELKTYNGDTEEWVVTVTVGNTTVTRPITEDELEMSFYDIVDRGGFKWQKRDWETFDDSPLGGGSFAHIEFRLYNLSHDELGSDVNNDGIADATANVAGDERNDTTVGDTTDGDYDTGRVKVTPGLRNDATADGDTEITVIAEGENKGKLEGALSEEITLNNITERSSSGLYEKQTVTAYTVPNVKVGYVLEMGVPDAKDGCYGSRWNPATESYVSELDELTGYIGTFMTDEHGYFETSDHFLPYGTYMIVECRTGEGYKLYHDGTSNVGNNVEMDAADKNTYSSSNKTPDVKIRQQFNIRADREMVDLTNDAKANTIQTTDWSKLGIDIAGTKQVTINGNAETVFLESADGKVDVFDGLAFVGFGDPLDIDGDGIRDNDWDFDNDGNQLWKYVKGTNGVTKFSVSYIMKDGGILNTVVFDTEAKANAFNSALNNQKRYYGTVNGTDGAKYTFTAIDKRTGNPVTMSYDTEAERDTAANMSDSAVYLTYGVKQFGSEYLTVVNDFDDLDILLASMSMLDTAVATTDSTALGNYAYDAEAGTDGHKITKTAYTSREVLVHDDAANIDYYVTRYEAVGEKNFPLNETKVYSTVNTNYPYGKYYETPGSEQKAGLDTDGDGIVTDYDQWNRGVERLYQHARGYTVVGDTSTAYATDADGNNYTSRSMSGWDDTADGTLTTGTSGTQANNDALQDVHATTQEGLNINGIWNRDTAHYGTDKEAYYTFINASIRGDFEIRKIDTYQHKMPNVRFLVRNKETGETHTFSTDENGEYRSTSPETIDPVTGGIAERVKTYSGDYELHSHNTNRGNANDGMWFGMTVDGSVAPVDDTLGALPYGTYDIVELPSEANGYTMDPEKALSRAENEAFYDEKGVAWYQTSAAMLLWQDTFTIYKDNQTVYLNNIENIPIGENEYMQSEALGNTDRNTTDKWVWNNKGLTSVVKDKLTLTDLRKMHVAYVETDDNGDVIYYTDPDETGARTVTTKENNGHPNYIKKKGNSYTYVDPSDGVEKTVTYLKYEKINADGSRSGIFYNVDTNAKDDEGNLLPQAYVKEKKEADGTNATGSVTPMYYEGNNDIIYIDKDGNELRLEPVTDTDGLHIRMKAVPIEYRVASRLVAFTTDDRGLPVNETAVVYNGEEVTGKVKLSNFLANYTYKDSSELIFHYEGNSGWTTMPEEIYFTFDASKYQGMNIMACEELQMLGTNGEWQKVVKEDVGELTDAILSRNEARFQKLMMQVLFVPGILNTTALGKDTGAHITIGQGRINIKDTVVFRNLPPQNNTYYTLTGILMKKITAADGTVTEEELLDNEGNRIVQSTRLTFTDEDNSPNGGYHGQTEVEFDFAAPEGVDGNDLVVFEVLSMGGVGVVDYEERYQGQVLAEHTDIDDEEQTVHVPKIGTTAVDATTETKTGNATGTTTIVDTVAYKNLIAGETYQMKGTLYKKSDGEPLLDGNGETYTVAKDFVATSTDGTVELRFDIDSSILAGETIVAFESCSYNGIEVALHADIEDEGQSVHFPKILSEAKDDVSQTHVGSINGSTVIRDKVIYENLVPGQKYVLVGKLINRSTERFVRMDGGDSDSIIPQNDEEIFEGDDAPGAEGGADGIEITDDDEPGTGGAGGTEGTGTGGLVVEDDEGGSGAGTGVDDDGNIVISDDDSIALHESSRSSDTDPFSSAGFNADIDIADDTEDGDSDVNLLPTGNKNSRYASYLGEILANEDDGILDDITEAGEDGNDITINPDGTLDNNSKIYRSLGSTFEQINLFTNDAGAMVATTVFVPKKSSGYTYVNFMLDTRDLTADTVVAYEKLYVGGTLVTSHEEIDDEDQAIYFPDLGTTAVDGSTLDQVGTVEPYATIIDTVQYKNLVPGKEYTIKGTLMQKSNKPVQILNEATKELETVTQEVSFTPEEPSGSVNLVYELDSSFLAGSPVVVFEDLYTEGMLVGTHADIEDDAQTVYYPKLGTMASDAITGEHVGIVADRVTLVDKVEYKNLVPNKTYTISGKLMNKVTGDAIAAGLLSNTNQIEVEDGRAVDVMYDPVKQSATFTAKEANGIIELPFEFDSSSLEGYDIVAFESLYHNNTKVASHEDINDEGQTVSYPHIGTTAVDANTKTKTGQVKTAAEIVDTVIYKNLWPGLTYTITGKLMDKETGKEIDADGLLPGVFTRETLDNGKVTQTVKKIVKDGGATTEVSVEFTPLVENGTVDMSYMFNSSPLAGHTAVAFEYLNYNGTQVTKHEDINDVDQSVQYPEIGTTATDKDTGTHKGVAKEKSTVVDEVRYKNLKPGRTYTIKGVLMNKETGKELGLPGTTAEVTFSPEKADGSVTLTFTFDATTLLGKKIVAFETLYDEDIYIVSHEDLEDEDQTVEYPETPPDQPEAPEIRTTATINGTKTAIGGQIITITDEVTYNNLTPGQEYTIRGTLMDKATGAAYKPAGSEITSAARFTPEKANGVAKMEFTFDTGAMDADLALVVFEKLYDANGELTASHEDINDEAQTVRIVKPDTEGLKTTASIYGGKTYTLAPDSTEELTVLDDVVYFGLKPGKTYTIKGSLMDKATGQVFNDGNNNVTLTGTFTPETESGKLQMPFTFSSKNVTEGINLVAFESVSLDGEIVATHEDLNDNDQTVTILREGKPGVPSKNIPPSVKTADVARNVLLIMLAAIAILTGLLVIRKRNKK